MMKNTVHRDKGGVAASDFHGGSPLSSTYTVEAQIYTESQHLPKFVSILHYEISFLHLISCRIECIRSSSI